MKDEINVRSDRLLRNVRFGRAAKNYRYRDDVDLERRRQWDTPLSDDKDLRDRLE